MIQHLPQVVIEAPRTIRTGQRSHHDPGTVGESAQLCGDRPANPASSPMALDGAADLLADDQAHARRDRVVSHLQVQHHAPTAGPAATAGGVPEVRRGPQPVGCREHVAGQADRRSRPLDRRAARMERPARVLIRARKPWVLARRRVLGWKVRFMVMLLGVGSRFRRRACRRREGQQYVTRSHAVKPALVGSSSPWIWSRSLFHTCG